MAAKEALRLDTKLINGSIALPIVVNDYSPSISESSGRQDGNDPSLRELLLPTFLLSDVRIIRFPQTRCSAVSYVILLMDDTALNAHQFRIGLADTRLCQCGQDIEDVHHYLLTCEV